MAKPITRKEAEQWLHRVDQVADPPTRKPLRKRRRYLLDFSDWAEEDLADCCIGYLGK